MIREYWSRRWLNPFILAGLFCLFSISRAGTTGKISGRVTDAETGVGLPGVNVLLEGTSLGASTDADGIFFIINIPVDTYSARAEMIGYTTMRITDIQVLGDLTTETNFQLGVKILESQEEVVVVAERPLVQKDLTSGRSIVSSEDIKEMPVETISGVISTKAGIVSSPNGAIHVRGGRSSEVSYMIDGVPITNPAWGGLGVSLENSAVQELQILSGTFNAEYGQAMSGIINIVTKEGGSKFTGNLMSYAGDYYSGKTDVFEYADQFDLMNIRNLEGSLSGPVPIPGLRNKLSFFISGRAYSNGGLYRGVREHAPGDVNFLTSRQVEDLRDSPYGRAGLLNFAEPFTDLDGDGELAAGSEPYFDFDGNGDYDTGEPFRDMNGDGIYQHELDLNGDGISDPEEREFVDMNGDGVLNGDPFLDINGNGVLDGEPFIDHNGNGVWDSGATGDGAVVRLNRLQRRNLQGKITWRITPKMKLNINTLQNQSRSVSYSLNYKYNPAGRPVNESTSLSVIADLTHSLSERLFYSIKGSFYETYSKSYYRDVQPDELVEERTENYSDLLTLSSDILTGMYDVGNFFGPTADSMLILQTTYTLTDSLGEEFDFHIDRGSESGLAGFLEYSATARPEYLVLAQVVMTLNDVKNALFLPNEISERPDNEFFAGGHSHSWSERRNQTYLLSGDLTWQANNVHQVKTGAGIKQHVMDYKAFSVFVEQGEDWIPTAKTPETSFSNDSYDNWLSDAVTGMQYSDRRPNEAYFYIQDKIELTDMIVNLGLRYDYFNPHYFIPSDYSDPDNPRYLLYTVDSGEEGIVDTLFSEIGEVGDYMEILDTLNALGEPWKNYNDFFTPTKAVNQFSPRIGVAYPITDRGIIHFSYGHFFQIPTFAYLFSNPELEISTDNFGSTMGNAALKPQKTVTYELGLQQQLTDDLGIELIAFYKDFSGLLSLDIQERYHTVRYTLYSNRD